MNERNRGISSTMLLCLTFLLIGACDRVHPLKSHHHLSGAFALLEADGAPLPYALPGSGDLVIDSLLAETLVFSPSGEVTHVRTIRRLANGGDSTFSTSFAREFRLWGDSMEIGRFTPCGPTEYCVGNDAGRIDSKGIRLTSRILWFGQRPPHVSYVPK